MTAGDSGAKIESDLYGDNPVYQGLQPSMIRKSPAQIRNNAEDFEQRTGCSWPHKDDTDTSTGIGNRTLRVIRVIPRDANFHTRMRDRWINRLRIIQAFRSALESVRGSISTRQFLEPEIKLATLNLVDRAIKSLDNSEVTKEVEVTEEVISNWSFTGAVTVKKLVREHELMTNAWCALTDSQGPVFSAVYECNAVYESNADCNTKGLDLSALELRFETEGGSPYVDYTHFKALRKIWPENTPSPDMLFDDSCGGDENSYI